MDWNRWAAEKVMGWPEKQMGYNWVWLTGGTYDRGDGYQILCNIHQGDWNPLHDKNHLWIVVEKIRELGWEINVVSTSLKHLPKWQVIFYTAQVPYPNHREYIEENDNLNLAVLEAAKKALEWSE